MAIRKDLGSAARNAAANKNGHGIKDSWGWVDRLSRWPQLTCHNLVGISPILSLFVSIVGVSWSGNPLSALLVVLYIIYIFKYITVRSKLPASASGILIKRLGLARPQPAGPWRRPSGSRRAGVMKVF